ncbi:Putative DNA polymerase [[Torrubiella] hemipterigena]|uniref:DNA polymerase n=1 Tax=[Torrubiella] hemipterigena TaxID=1531966 RepID=A0A0A1T9B9_9HYPO|nr:Putative DNA polymerase [[Torrubiella] hemipterigena]
MNVFRVRINCIDHYQAAPTRYDPQLRNDERLSQSLKGPKVPVIRVFGSTEHGQKVCAHIHGAFPYLYVEYNGPLEAEQVGVYIYRLHLSIDHALAVSYRRDQDGGNARFVARITLVKATPFYGYHVGYRFYLKIYLFNPVYMNRLADLLQQGVILKQKFQPFEAHLQYIPQFMTDYNLYGCDYLDSSQTWFRAPVPEVSEDLEPSLSWNQASVPSERITDDLSLPRVSHCGLEVDISVQDIKNRKHIKSRSLHHDFVELFNPLPIGVKLVHSLAGLWRDETTRRKRRLPVGKQGLSPFPPEVLVSMSADSQRLQSQNWVHEDEYRAQLQSLVDDEKNAGLCEGRSFDNFVHCDPIEDSINTALQSVEDLYPDKLLPALGLPSNVSMAQDPSSSIEVDEQMALKSDAINDDDMLEEPADTSVIPPSPSAELKGASQSNQTTDYCAGVCASGFVTGSLPRLPHSDAFITAAEDLGFIGRTGNETRMLDFRMTTWNASQRSKRSAPATTNSGLFKASAGKRPRLDKSSSQQGKSGRLAPPSSSQTLNFPIVKDQNDPHTRYRLSQKSRDSHSQNNSLDADSSKIPSSMPTPAEEEARPSQPQTQSQNEDPEEQPLIRRCDFGGPSTRRTLIYAQRPPQFSADSSLPALGFPEVIYQDAFYSREQDVPSRNREYAGREYRLEGNTLPFLPEFQSDDNAISTTPPNQELLQALSLRLERQRRSCSWRTWEIDTQPPSASEVMAWLRTDSTSAASSQAPRASQNSASRKKFMSQIDGPTPRRRHVFKYTQKRKTTSVQHEVSYMSTMSLEVHVNTRGKLVPNPEEDEVQCIFWSCKGDDVDDGVVSGLIVLDAESNIPQRLSKMVPFEVRQESTELDLLVTLVDVVRSLDPDILTGYEVHGGSWGFLMERARLRYDYNLCDELSRMKTESHGRFGKQSDRWGFNTTSTIRITGRHMINIWRAMRSELALLQYTLENVAWHLLHLRTPHYTFRTLTNWYKSTRLHDISKVIRYYHSRTRMDLDILDANELIPRTSEQARLLGVDFFSVFSRGSQFKVESIMFRIAKPENLLLVSPSKKQVGGQNALECLPLVMEPQSAFYSSPVLVLDFQSLYPSVMIAYNYCYSTFLGRIMNWRGASKMGFTEYKRQEGLLNLLRDHINIAPNGMMYAKTEVRKSLLAKMLTEILETRVMVKSGMKQDKDDKMLQQLLNNRQLALKLLANVTYGYTSASFSGRMPCAEIADSIVQTGRETLERAIALIHSVERWNAEVVYGDTDSLFVHLKGRTKDEAFDIGNEIAAAVTKANPRPVKLKFEKVYLPCVLLAKKRYVGYMYETKDQETPVFDAKGIETVRRDGTPAEQKIEEKALRMLFETADLSQIKQYFQSQCEKIMKGSVSVQDFCFAKEVRLGSYSDKGPPPAGALISTKKMLEDARAEPQYGERVPYVVVTGAPGARLIDRCVAPEELLANPHWQLDAEYYISKNLIPPLERIFNLVGANVRQWYDEMPKIQRVHQVLAAGSKRSTLESYMKSTHCPVCSVKFRNEAAHSDHEDTPLCPDCRANVPASLLALETKVRIEEKKYQELLSICTNCTGHAPLDEIRCDSKDCPVFWSRMRQKNRVIGERASTRPVIRGLLASANAADLEW